MLDYFFVKDILLINEQKEGDEQDCQILVQEMPR